MIRYSNNIEEGVVNTERDKIMVTPYTAYARETAPSVFEYVIWISGFAQPSERRINAIKAVRVIAKNWADRNEYRGAHPLAGLREAKDFVESIMNAMMKRSDPANFIIAMPADDEDIHEALIATVLCQLRVPFTLERKV